MNIILRSLQLRIILFIGIVISIFSIGISYVSVHLLEDVSIKTRMDGAILLARGIDASIESKKKLENPELLKREVFTIVESNRGVNNIHIFLFHKDKKKTSNNVRYLIDSDTTAQFSLSPLMVEHVQTDKTYYKIDGTYPNPRQMLVVSPLHLSENVIGGIAITMTLGSLDDMLRERRRQLLLVSMLVVAIMVISLGVLMHTMVTMPIRRLVQGMQKVESGDLLFRIHSKRKDEIGQLTSQFNHMVKELADSSEKNYVLIAEIEQFNKNLQQRVDETTAELKERNLELQDVNGRLMMMQRRLMDAERLTTLGQVVVNIAHEIGSPLGAISGHIQLMKTESGLSPEITKRLDIVDQQINRVVNIIEQMLNSVREKTPESQPVDIKNILDSVLYLVSPLLNSQHIRLQVHMQEGLPKIMMTDESLQQVVLNLINNAIDAMPQGGELHISTELIAGKDAFQKDMVQIQIRDQGMGINPGDINQIFKPFFTTKPSGEGTGMGLALCKDIVEKYHGKITCQSQLGQGTVFIILFPVQSDSA